MAPVGLSVRGALNVMEQNPTEMIPPVVTQPTRARTDEKVEPTADQ